MYEYQEEHISNIIEGFSLKHNVVDGSKAGSGKTRMSIRASNKMGMIPFVLCSKTMLSFWMQELNEEKTLKYNVVHYECFKSGRFFKNDGYRTISLDKIKFKKFEPNTLVIFDEIHVCRNDTQTQKMLDDIIESGVRILGLSGTIGKNDKYLPDYHFVKTNFKSNAANNVIWTNKYTEANKVSFVFQDVSRLELRKIPLYLDLFYKNKDKRVVMFCFFNETIRRLNIELKDFNPLIVNGINTDTQNGKNIEHFQKNGGLLLVNAQLGGSSLNLQNKIDATESVSICNISWSEVIFEQMLHRIYRVNSTSDCYQHILVTEEPLDKYMCATLLKKLNNLITH